jgi:hypothetical protein
MRDVQDHGELCLHGLGQKGDLSRIMKKTWTDIRNVLNSEYHEPDSLAARALYSSVVAHGFNGPPTWLMVVGAPSSTSVVTSKPAINGHFKTGH